MGLINRINQDASSFIGDLSTLDSKWSISCIIILVYLLFIFFVLVIKNTQNLLDEFFANKKIKSFFLSKPKLYSFIRFLIIVPYILLLGGRYFILLPAFYYFFFNIEQKPYFIWDINMIIILMSFSLFFIGFNLYLKKKKYGYFGKFSILMAGFSLLIYIYFIMHKLGIYEFHFQDVKNWSLFIISIVCEYILFFSNLFNLSTVANIGEIFKTILKIILNRVSPGYRYYYMFKSIYQLYFKVLKNNIVDDSTDSILNDDSNQNYKTSGNWSRFGIPNIDDWINEIYSPENRITQNFCWDLTIPFSLPASSDVNPNFRAGIRNSDTFWGTKTVNNIEYPLVFYDSIFKIPYHYALLDPNYEEMVHKYKNSIIKDTSHNPTYAERMEILKNKELLFNHYIKLQQQHTLMMKSLVFHKILALDSNFYNNVRGIVNFDAFEVLKLNPASVSHHNVYYHFYDYQVYSQNNNTLVFDPKFVKQYCFFTRNSASFNSELFLAHCHKLERLETYLLNNKHHLFKQYIQLDYLPRMNKETYFHIDASYTKYLKLLSLNDFRYNMDLNAGNKELYMACVIRSMDIIEECVLEYVGRRNDITQIDVQVLREEYRYLLNCWRRLEIDKVNVLFEANNLTSKDPLLNLKWGFLKNEEWIQNSQMLPMLVKKNPCLIAHIKYPQSAVINEIARLHSTFAK